MKKAILIILAIAIIGALGILDKAKGGGSPHLVAASNTSAAITAATSSSNQASNNSTSTSTASYKDGTYTGNAEEIPYGTVQIAVVISGGKISGVNFLQMPNDQRESEQRSQYSEPLLKQTTIANQSANIDFVSGATDTSMGYQQSLQSALDQAKVS